MTAGKDVETRNHWWWRPGWRKGRSFYTWHVTFDDQPKIHKLAKHYQSLLSHVDALDLIPRVWLHMTTQGIGFADEVDMADVTAIKDAVAANLANFRPPTIELGPAQADAEGINLPVRPEKAMIAIRGHIRQAIAAVWGAERVPEPEEGLSPHVSLAYANTSGVPLAPIHEILSQELNAIEAIAIRQISLIELNRDNRMYQWKEVGSALLGAGLGTD